MLRNEAIASRTFIVGGRPVVLDSDLAQLLGVPTKRLNEKVRRYPQRFPRDFAFLLSAVEWNSIRSQIATSSGGRRPHRRFLPYVFTAEGALMASGRLPSKRAIDVSVWVVRELFAMRDVLGDDFGVILRP